MAKSTQVISFDASVTSQYPSSEYGSYKDLAIESASPVREAFMYFVKPAFPPGTTVISATLHFFERYVYGGGSRTITAGLLVKQFTESKINYNNRPGVISGAPTASATQGDSTAPDRPWAIDIGTLMQAVADGTPWNGLRLTSNNATKFFIWSSEAFAALKPWVEIEYVTLPEQPSSLSPSGGRAISVARPVHRWGSREVAANEQSAFQIQWSTSEAGWTAADGFSSPTLDTGTVTDNVPEWTPTVDVAAAQVVFWCVRVRDVIGQWSSYSLPVSFTRTGKPVLTILSPGVAPNDYVTESTPPVSWSLPGQSAFQVFIVDPNNRSIILNDSKKRTSTEVAYTIPANVLTQTGSRYGLLVRGWDDKARETIAGDPAYVEAYREFGFELSNTIAPVTGLSIVQYGETPGVSASFSRATAPDGFQRRIDGVFVGRVFEPHEIFVSGTQYAFDDWSLTPRTTHTYEMVPIENGKAADNNPVAAIRTEPIGIWLSGTDGENAICLSTGSDIGEWDDTTISAVHQGIGTPFAMVRTQVLGARKTTQSGTFSPRRINVPGATFEDLQQHAHDLRSPAGQMLRVALSNTNVVGVVDKMKIWPADEDEMIRVDFDFYEQDDASA